MVGRKAKRTALVAAALVGTIGHGAPALAAGTLTSSAPAVQLGAGDFAVIWAGSKLSVLGAGRVAWDSVAGESFVAASTHALQAKESRGSFVVRENVLSTCSDQTVTAVRATSGAVVIEGRVSGDTACSSDYTLTFRQALRGHLRYQLTFANPAVNASELAYSSTPTERFHGFGEQPTVLNLKGRNVAVFMQEGGIGRGAPLLTNVVNLFSPGSGGGPLTTYYAVPQYVTNTGRSLFLENTEYATFDLRAPSRVRVRLFAPTMTGRILAGDSMLELIERFTEYSGRMAPLPDWINEGAVLGVQGGTAKVSGILDELQRRGTPVGGVWMQDWVGRRRTAAGSQLWWNWELDRDLYPDWDGLVTRVERNGGRVLCYVNPFLVDATPKGNVRRNLYQEAIANGYLIKDERGAVYKITNTDFAAGLLDLTNPAAVRWIKDVIKQQVLGEARCGGWMHDYGEALPFDAVLHSGQSAASYHNQYPVDWARIAREAITEAGQRGAAVAFVRAGHTQTPGVADLVWQGDQMVTWDEHDGLRSAVLGATTGGFSGITLNHADIGGYTGLAIRGIGITRPRELLLRWMEYAAFTTTYRTHEGIAPRDNAQFYSNDATYTQFDRFAKVYKALAFYRRDLFGQARDRGWPVVRHPMLHFPNEPGIERLTDHFLLGSEFLVAPVVEPRGLSGVWRKVYFPEGDRTTWVHALTGERYGRGSNAQRPPASLRLLNPARGRWQWVRSPIGSPPVFYREGSAVGRQFVDNLRALGIARPSA